MRIAIIGAGISGLTAAHALQHRHDVTLYEAESYAGGHTRTVEVEVDGRRLAVDTGFIVFNTRQYPRFTELLEALDVPSDPTRMSFSVRSDRSGLEYGSASVGALLAQPGNLLRPAFYGMVRDILRLHATAHSTPWPNDAVTVAEWTTAHGFGTAFVDEYLVPLGASLWSSPPDRFRSFPMRFVLEFLSQHDMLQVSGQPTWRTVRGGSARYVEALLGAFTGTVRLGCPVARVSRTPRHVVLREPSGAEESFDHAIFACHADQALRLLADPSPVEREVLGAFPYQRNDVLLHTDARVLPRRRRAWASWNYHVPADDRQAVSVTYNMNRLQGLRTATPINVTLNDSGVVDPARVLGRFLYHHPLFLPGRDAAQRRHHELLNVNRTSYCGAYWGFGFHEDGVRSALAAVRELRWRVAA